MRRSALAALMAVLLSLPLVACSTDGPAPRAYDVTPGTSGSVDGKTYQTVLLGPGETPVASADIAPTVFRDDSSIRRALETSLPAAIASGQDPLGNHLILAVSIAGAAETDDGVDVYADLWEAWYSLAGWQPVDGSAAIYPARIRLKRAGDSLRFEGFDIPEDGEGYGASLDEILPRWVRDRVDSDVTREHMQKAIWAAAEDWAAEHVPEDLFVDQVKSTVADPHGHRPPSSRYHMLAPRYVDCTLTAIAPPPSDSYQAEFAQASDDGRFRLHHLLSGDVKVAVEDTNSGTWHALIAPGEPLGAVSGTVGFDPAWVGHTLFIDFDTVVDPYQPTSTHYEVDFDSMRVVRAVPMGPLSFNKPLP